MRIEMKHDEELIIWDVVFSDSDFSITREEESEKLSAWEKMLKSSLCIEKKFYPLYEFDSKIIYLFGWVDAFEGREMSTTFGFIQRAYMSAKEKREACENCKHGEPMVGNVYCKIKEHTNNHDFRCDDFEVKEDA